MNTYAGILLKVGAVMASVENFMQIETAINYVRLAMRATGEKDTDMFLEKARRFKKFFDIGAERARALRIGEKWTGIVEEARACGAESDEEKNAFYTGFFNVAGDSTFIHADENDIIIAFSRAKRTSKTARID